MNHSSFVIHSRLQKDSAVRQERIRNEFIFLPKAQVYAIKYRMIYLFANEKGGVGKSTLATSFAVYLHDAGRRVAVLDADKQMHTARALAEVEPKIRVGTLFEANLIPKTIRNLAKEYDDVVADAPARLDDEARALMVVAETVIFPMEPTIKSLRSTKASIEVLSFAREITGGKPEFAWVVINKAKKRTRLLREIEEAATGLGLTVAKTVIRDLQAFPDADQQGKCITRLKGESPSADKAKSDLLSFFDEIAQKAESHHRIIANE